MKKLGKMHIFIPDTQFRPGDDLNFFKCLGKYVVEKQPDVLIHGGDLRDMPSLSSYDSPVARAARGTCKMADIEIGNKALEIFENELVKGKFQPKKKIILGGNHDCFSTHGRIGRYLAEHPDDKGLITKKLFVEHSLGWKTYPFLDIVEIDGVSYSHLFPFNKQGRTSAATMRMGASSAKNQVDIMMRSCTAGHKQGLDVHIHHGFDRTFRGLVAGSCYEHHEEYMGPGNNHWRGFLVKHNVGPLNVNAYDLMEVPLEALKRKYRGTK